MTALVLDGGAFLAVERNERSTVALLKVAHQRLWSRRSNGGVLAEMWRGGQGRQVMVARLLKAVELMPVDQVRGRAAGDLLRDAGGGSAIDATVVAVAEEGDRIVTGDPADMEVLVHSSGRRVTIVAC